jgi:hypothetical protein
MNGIRGTQAPEMWSMFFFGFLTLFVVTQMYGLNLKRPVRWAIIAGYLALIVLVYSGRWVDTNEVLRIPVIEYGLVFVMALLYWLMIGVRKGIGRIRSGPPTGVTAD